MKKFKLNLQLFDDGEMGESSQDAADTMGEETNQDAADVTETESFDNLIKGKYAKEYKDKTESIVKQRVSKAQKTIAERDAQIAGYAPIMDALALKYGIDKENINGIVEALQNDDSVYEEQALKEGLTIDQYKYKAKIEAENQRYKAEQAEKERQAYITDKLNKWNEEAKDIQKDFPNFDLDTYMQNQQFQALLKNGVGLRQAYIALDADHIIPDAMAYTAQVVQKKTADNIAARGSRPMENGLSGQASANVKVDVSTLTNEQVADMVERAARGEIIRFS